MHRTLPALAAAVALLLSAAAHAAEVKNPAFRQEGNRIVVTYDLEADGPAPVAVKGSQDGGRTWDLNMQHVSGDVGEKVAPGKRKRLVWDVLRDYPRGLASSQVVFDLETSGSASFTDPITGMEFVLVKGGTFEMGDLTGDGRANENPVHTVTVSDFYLGKYEVTVGQFRKFVEATGHKTDAEKEGFSWRWSGKEYEKKNGASWKNPGFSQDDRHPVVDVSWNDATAFAKWLSQQTGKAYRLPTEAEWEYAARAGTKTRNYWGDGTSDACGYANVADRTAKKKFSGWTIHECDDGYTYTAPVGKYKSNPLGLYDMIGNVWEWCSDWYGEGYYRESPKQDPKGPSSGELRVLRGGSWSSEPGGARAAFRNWDGPAIRIDIDGFRLALASPPP